MPLPCLQLVHCHAHSTPTSMIQIDCAIHSKIVCHLSEVTLDSYTATTPTLVHATYHPTRKDLLINREGGVFRLSRALTWASTGSHSRQNMVLLTTTPFLFFKIYLEQPHQDLLHLFPIFQLCSSSELSREKPSSSLCIVEWMNVRPQGAVF